jgi:hypothetical protein
MKTTFVKQNHAACLERHCGSTTRAPISWVLDQKIEEEEEDLETK